MVDKVTFKIPLRLNNELKGVNDPDKVKKEIGDYLVEEILDHVGEGRSPITGRGFKGLSTKYKKLKSEYSSSTIPNMELTGDMLDALTFKLVTGGVEVGIFNSHEAKKADNHNKFSSASKSTNVPQRRFIPKSGEDNFKRSILDEVARIIEENKVEN